MDFALPTPPNFSIGTTSTVPPGPAVSMDMSLDELIKARRTADKKSLPTQQNRRTNLKSKTNNAFNKKPNIVQKSIGANKAKRNANAAAKRGISTDNKPTPMQLEREAYRQQRGGGGPVGSGPGKAPRRSNRIRTNSNNNKTEADRKIKAKNVAEKKRNARNANNTKQKLTEPLSAPSKKQVTAAVKAMSTAGFTAPKGMKMVISFAPTAGQNNAKKQNKKTQGKPQGKQQGNTQGRNQGNKGAKGSRRR